MEHRVPLEGSPQNAGVGSSRPPGSARIVTGAAFRVRRLPDDALRERMRYGARQA
ncbi:MAG: hypothetical protein M3380_14725 [Chloroflexota bacterium]|nr:hypothetical protein [Chloroflexota bacterium]